METYIFETRKASAPFLKAFTNKLKSQIFHVKENNNLINSLLEKSLKYLKSGEAD